MEASAERRFEWERFDPSRDDVPLLQLQLGIQSVYVSDLGFDPFSKNDSLTMPGASLSATLWQGGPFSFATGVFWEYGSTSATARGARTRLKAHRFGVGLEGRYHLARWLYAYARATPGLMAESASVDMMDRSSELEDSHLLLSMSGSGGLAVCLSARRPGSPRSGLAFWVLGEGGYLWSERATISLAPPSREDGAAEGNVTLGGLSLSGGFFRVSLAATY